MPRVRRDKDHIALSDEHNARGIELADHGMLDEAIKEFKKAIELDPDSAHAHDNLATVYAEKKLYREALAEYLHKIVRTELAINVGDADNIQRLFSQGYQGSRYSFGYPACPELADQVKLFELLRPERIDITLTEEYHLEPEQSTTAIICHHPEARYFGIK